MASIPPQSGVALLRVAWPLRPSAVAKHTIYTIPRLWPELGAAYLLPPRPGKAGSRSLIDQSEEEGAKRRVGLVVEETLGIGRLKRLKLGVAAEIQREHNGRRK